MAVIKETGDRLAIKNIRPAHGAIRAGLAGLVLTGMQACTTDTSHIDGPPAETIDITNISDAVPKDEPKSRYGNPESYVVNGKKYYVRSSSKGFFQIGIASWYGRKFHGRRTSSGESFNMYTMSAAHKTLPLPTYVEVVNVNNGKRVVVRVNDRGPFHENRVIDLSYTAALKLDIVREGTALVEIRAIDPEYPQHDITPVKPVVNDKSNVFFIQVGSFNSYDNAVNLKKRLAGLADSLIQISEASIENKKLYRVRFGPITDINTADTIVANLDRYGVNEHHIDLDL